MRKSLAASVVIGSVLTLGMAGTAVADPPAADENSTTTLSCNDGSSYNIVVAPGNGSWTPAFDVNGKSVFIPLAFEGFFFRITDANTGEVYVEESDPGVETKNYKTRGRPVLRCSFVDEVLSVDDPEFGTDVIYSFGGEVTGMRTR